MGFVLRFMTFNGICSQNHEWMFRSSPSVENDNNKESPLPLSLGSLSELKSHNLFDVKYCFNNELTYVLQLLGDNGFAVFIGYDHVHALLK